MSAFESTVTLEFADSSAPVRPCVPFETSGYVSNAFGFFRSPSKGSFFVRRSVRGAATSLSGCGHCSAPRGLSFPLAVSEIGGTSLASYCRTQPLCASQICPRSLEILARVPPSHYASKLQMVRRLCLELAAVFLRVRGSPVSQSSPLLTLRTSISLATCAARRTGQ